MGQRCEAADKEEEKLDIEEMDAREERGGGSCGW